MSSVALVTPGKLTWGICRQLGKKIRPEDAIECLHKGYTPEMAMFSGIGTGEAYAAFHGLSAIGAFGWTKEGRVWSLWAPLTKAESLSVLRQTPEWVSRMVAHSGRPFLDNKVHALNRKAIAWLKASKCFQVDREAEPVDGQPYHYFSTRHDVLRKYLQASSHSEPELCASL